MSTIVQLTATATASASALRGFPRGEIRASWQHCSVGDVVWLINFFFFGSAGFFGQNYAAFSLSTVRTGFVEYSCGSVNPPRFAAVSDIAEGISCPSADGVPIDCILSTICTEFSDSPSI